MRTNIPNKIIPVKTFEGSRAFNLTNENQLRRAIAACLLWEDQFYENGISIAERIKDLTLSVKPSIAADIARLARTDMKLRHAPLWIANSLSMGNDEQRAEVANLLYDIIQRADELGEFLSIYWGGKKRPIAASVKRGLARAFTKFNEYQLAKYNRDAAIKLRDVLFLVHPKPLSEAQQKLWDKLAKNELETPDTWEVNLSAGKDKKETFERLIEEKKLGALATLRNLRNMIQSGVDEEIIRVAISEMKTERVLPFRFITAARYAPRFEPELEQKMFECIEHLPKLEGKTAIIVDTSPSMWHTKVSAKSEMDRFDAAAALAILCKETCTDTQIFTFDRDGREIPNRRGFALRDAMNSAKNPQGGSFGNGAVALANKAGYDRIIVLTDGEWHFNSPRMDSRGGPAKDIILPPLTDKAYLINVGAYNNAIGSGKYTMIDGWSEAIIDYIQFVEK